jgi:hypothetical protein
MVHWLVPICLFVLFASIFLGVTSIEPRGGGGLRQVLGLLASAAVHVGIWNVLRIGFGMFMPQVGAMIFASLISIPCILLAAWIGFMVFGVKLGKAVAAH